MKKARKSLVFTMIVLFTMLPIFPNYAYGSDDAIESFSFKTLNEYYFCAEDGGGKVLTADRDKIGPWEKFQLIAQGKGYYAIKSQEGYYLTANDDEKGVMVDGVKIANRQKFKLIRLENDMFALKTCYDKYICAEDGGGGKVVADRTEIGKWESFELVKNTENILDDKCTLSVTSDNKSATFTWTKPNNTKNIIGYNLYRSTASGKQSNTPVTDFPIEGTSYTDKNLNTDTKYYYIVKVLYKDKTLGASSNEVSVILKPSITLNAEAVDNGISLSWNKLSHSNNVVGYYIYRATQSGKQSDTPITDFPITETTYLDKNIENNKTYFYVLKAVYKDKTQGDPSNEISIKSSFGKTIILQVGSKHIYINGKKTEIDPGKGTEAIIKNGRTFLPIRAVIEAMGGDIEWDNSSRKVSIYLDDHEIYLWIGNKNAKVDGRSKETDVAPYISETNRTMLPLRFILENLDCEVDWDGSTQKVTIKTKY